MNFRNVTIVFFYVMLICLFDISPLISANNKHILKRANAGFDLTISQGDHPENDIVLKWYPSNPNITGYRIVSTQKDNNVKNEINVESDTEYILRNLKKNTEYEFMIIGYGQKGQLISHSVTEKFVLNPKPKHRMLQFSGNALQEPSAKLVMTALDASHFPHILSAVRLDVNNIGKTIFDAENFQIFENGNQQDSCFHVTPPDSSGGIRMLDLVFIIDNSGSLEPEHREVWQNIENFVDSLQVRAIDYRLGLVRFGQLQNWGNPILVNNGNLIKDVEMFKDWICNMTTDGGLEPGLEAIYHAAKNMNFRPGSSRHFLLITDEDSDNGDLQQAIDVCKHNNIIVHCAVDPDAGDSFYNYCEPATSIRSTGGLLFPVIGPYNQILNELQRFISNTYIVRYRTDNPVYDATSREVIIKFSYLEYASQDTGYYTPGEAPKIIRTPETKALSDSALLAGLIIPISAYITDRVAPFVHTASLYFRQLGESEYDCTPMLQLSDSLYSAQIPDSFVVADGLEYYITAADNYITSSAPQSDPALHPYQIAIYPNFPPRIIHTPIESVPAGIGIPVDCDASDSTYSLAQVKLHYRKAGTLIYISVEMVNTGHTHFFGKIPDSYVTTDGVDYYISAADDFGITATHGTSSEPHQIIVTHCLKPIPILIVGREGAGNKAILDSLGHYVTYYPDVCVLDTLNLSEFDQIWYCEYLFLPDSQGCANFVNFIKSGGNIFWVGEILFPHLMKHAAWRDSLLNSLGAGGIKQFQGHLWDYRPFEFATNPEHSITAGIECIGHETASYGGFDSVGTATWLVRDEQHYGKVLSVAFDKGDLTEAPDTRVVIYLNSNCQKNWPEFVNNMARWLEGFQGLAKPQTAQREEFVPTLFALSQNYPNPFNPDTRLGYQLPNKSHVIMKIYNCLGQEIRKLVDKNQESGWHEIQWDGLDSFGNETPSGLYFYTIYAGQFVVSKKMIKLR